jgi:ABC-2 type transport system permease protein
MSAYLSVFRARFSMLLQYRAAALAGFGTQLFWGLIRVMIFDAFYRSTTAVQPMTYEQTVTYLWLIQAMLMLLTWRVDADIQAMIRDGTLAYELVRPADLYWLWFARSVAARTAPLLLRAIPMFVVAGLFLGLQAPASPAAAGAWLFSVGGAILLGSAITSLMAISLLWTIAGDGISRLVATLTMLFSGSLIPLPFFPEWAQGILNALPFRGLMDIPFRLYMGHLPAGEIVSLLAHQLGWTVALVLLGRWVLGRGLRRMVIQGG